MALTRRQLIKQIGALTALAGTGGLSSVAQAARERLIPWKNWSGAQTCLPAARLAPTTEDELSSVLKATRDMNVRAVGSSHSFSPLIPTDGKLISLSNFSGLLSHDPKTLQAEFGAGTPMSQMGEPLLKVGQALLNMADIDYQTLAGAISTSTHGTGPKFGSYSSNVVGLRMVKANGDIVDLDKNRQPELFNAARVSLGSLGIITRVKLQNRKAFRLNQKQWVQNTDELIEDIPRLVKDNDHFEFSPILHSDVSLAQAQNETTDTKTMPLPTGGDGDKVSKLSMANTFLRNHPDAHASLLNFLVKHIDFPEVQDISFKVFANVRDQRFNEMEYEVPAAAGPECVREILKLVREKNLNSFFPLEYRYVKADDIPLSMFSGRDSCAISVHQSYDMAYQPFFSEIEPIFWKYEGRPHWGKLHTLNAAQLSKLYPRWKEFQDIRRSVDPTGKFLNGHLRSIFGVPY